MIIFDLDGTLADCEHRRHLVEPNKIHGFNELYDYEMQTNRWFHKFTGERWKPDYQAFFAACDKDTPIMPTICMWDEQISLGAMGGHQIWSGRCETSRYKAERWLEKNLLCFDSHQLKMRPIGDFTHDEELKERWLDEALAEGKTIDFVFDDKYSCCNMWIKRDILCFHVRKPDGYRKD
jgi:hypothetical protein